MDNVTPFKPKNPATLSQPPQLDARLDALLLSGESKIIGPKAAQALRQWIADAEAFEARLAMPTPDRVESLVGRLSLATAKRKIAQAEAEEIHDLYWRALKDMPLVDLAAAFDDLLKSATFLPTPAEIHTKAATFRAARRYAISRARHLVWRHSVEWVPVPADLVTAADLAAIKAKTAQSLGIGQRLENQEPSQ